jgi:membrane fusion protein (multidrug efflux system)
LESANGKNHQTQEGNPPRKKIRVGKMGKWGLRSAIFLALAAATVHYSPKILYILSHESTDDAYVNATVVPISAEVKGKVVKVFIEQNQLVKAGDPLLEIDPMDYTYYAKQKEESYSTLKSEEEEIYASIEEKKRALAQAQANLEAATEDEALASAELERYKNLIEKSVVSRSQYDHVESQWKVARARREAAHAGVAQAEAGIETLNARLITQKSKIKEVEASYNLAKLDLRRTLVAAPISGRIANKNVDPGKYVQTGQPLLSIVDTKDIWIVANFKEVQIEKMRIGQLVDIKVDSYPGITFKGHVDSFQPGTGSVFTLLPPENAAGSFVKVVQRLPVKITIDSPPDPARPLWPGLSVVPYVDTNEKKDLRKTSR